MDNYTWNMINNGPLINTVNYTLAVYTSDGTIICMAGS
jgi:hypothetical protein